MGEPREARIQGALGRDESLAFWVSEFCHSHRWAAALTTPCSRAGPNCLQMLQGLGHLLASSDSKEGHVCRYTVLGLADMAFYYHHDSTCWLFL